MEFIGGIGFSTCVISLAKLLTWCYFSRNINISCKIRQASASDIFYTRSILRKIELFSLCKFCSFYFLNVMNVTNYLIGKNFVRDDFRRMNEIWSFLKNTKNCTYVTKQSFYFEFSYCWRIFIGDQGKRKIDLLLFS